LEHPACETGANASQRLRTYWVTPAYDPSWLALAGDGWDCSG
jgi:hypothetical protein